MINLNCPECRSPRTAVTIDIPTGDRDRMCVTCGHHWYPAPLHPGLPTCCARTIQSHPRSQQAGSMLHCTVCRRSLVLRSQWSVREERPDATAA